MQDAEIRQDAAGDRVLNRHHAAVRVAAFDLASHFAECRARHDLDPFAPIPFGDNVVETPLVTSCMATFIFPFIFLSLLHLPYRQKSRLLTDRDFYYFSHKHLSSLSATQPQSAFGKKVEVKIITPKKRKLIHRPSELISLLYFIFYLCKCTIKTGKNKKNLTDTVIFFNLKPRAAVLRPPATGPHRRNRTAAQAGLWWLSPPAHATARYAGSGCRCRFSIV